MARRASIASALAGLCLLLLPNAPALGADPTICPENMPPASQIDPVFLIGSASGNSYYGAFIDQLELCGWPPEKIFRIEGAITNECMLDDIVEFVDNIDQIRTSIQAEKIDLLGYSLGAIRTRMYLSLFEGYKHANDVVLWGGPNQGLPYNAGVECWNSDMNEGSDFIACLNGTSSDPSCTNPFDVEAPLAVEATSALPGIRYYSFWGDDHFCAFCASFGGLFITESDAVVPKTNAQLAGAYNLDGLAAAHWEFFQDIGNGRLIWEQSMLGLLGRETDWGLDVDGDGQFEPNDNCPFVANAGQADGDSDGIGDDCDPCPGVPGGDFDGDGVCDASDNCVRDPNPTQLDSDFDGIGDACDACVAQSGGDTDGDGICQDVDNCPNDYNPFQQDADGDLIGDLCDTCTVDPGDDPDGDLICTSLDNCPAVANPTQDNADGDSEGDACDACPFDAGDDPDADGVCSIDDNCDTVANPGQANADGDSAGDDCDPCPNDFGPDLDGDNVCLSVDNCPLHTNPGQTDTDGDGEGDACDPCPLDPGVDPDGDGICTIVDNCPAVANPSQADGDSDGIGDACDLCPGVPGTDSDADGICDISDNCPLAANPGQEDFDSDGAGDVCDADADNDGWRTDLPVGWDCNDLDPAINPGAPEVPGNAVDENCNGSLFCGSVAPDDTAGARASIAVLATAFALYVFGLARRVRRNAP